MLVVRAKVRVIAESHRSGWDCRTILLVNQSTTASFDWCSSSLVWCTDVVTTFGSLDSEQEQSRYKPVGCHPMQFRDGISLERRESKEASEMQSERPSQSKPEHRFREREQGKAR